MRPSSSRRTRSGRQRGAALLTAMIIVTLVSTLASAMVWQQWRAVQVESAERSRAQAGWILAGALDFALLILREDQKNTRDPTTRLTEPWATPLAESRLSTFLSADNAADAGDDGGPEAFLSGTIADAQAKYNLLNLIVGDDDKKKRELLLLSRLCTSVGVDESVAAQIATRLAAANAASSSGTGGNASATAPLQPASVRQLTWFGISEATVRALEPYVILLPETTLININTAPKELLAAATGADLGSAERVVQIRQRVPFKSRDEALKQLGVNTTSFPSGTLDVLTSTYFEVDGRLRLADHVVTQHSLVQRQIAAPYRKVLRREFVSTVEESRSQ